MKLTSTSLAGTLLMVALPFLSEAQQPVAPETIALGTVAPKTDLKMETTTGKEVTLGALKQQNGLLVVFSCNTCPFVIGDGEGTTGWEGRYADVFKTAQINGVGMVLVNSNEAKREKGDNLEDMKKRARDQRFEQIPYALDKNSELANAFGARTTPHVFLFDKDMKLVYRGAIDDNVDDPKAVKANYLAAALEAVAKGKSIDPADTKPVGCSIKRVAVQ
ncbi:MAG: thioredoxin family protein [Flavobacteriales bacterium]|nr:thioredoxin family protein [Flavobacteriales bacterium]